MKTPDDTMHRAFVEAGYAPLRDYVERHDPGGCALPVYTERKMTDANEAFEKLVGRTPGPWIVDVNQHFPDIRTDNPDWRGQAIGDTCASKTMYPSNGGDLENHAKANAAFIVEACNAYDAHLATIAKQAETIALLRDLLSSATLYVADAGSDEDPDFALKSSTLLLEMKDALASTEAGQ